MNDEQKIWEKLLAGIGNAYGAAGMMGNLYAESGLQSNNLENLCQIRLGNKYTDETYTQAVDNGEITRALFLHPLGDSRQYGYGLAQWTSEGRKAGLYDLVMARGVSIADVETQMDWLLQELTKSYSSVMNVLKTATSVQEASDIVLVKYEAPADTGASVKAKRATYGQKYYDKYAKETTEMGVTAREYVNVMQSWVNWSEANGLFKQIIDLYNSVRPLPRGYAVKYTDEWCDTTVSAAAIKAGAVALIGRECGCEEHIKIFKQLGIWKEDGTITPEMGYIITYNWDKSTQPNDGTADHIGVVESVSNGQITVIEGNKGEAVARRVLSIGNGYIRGYASPKFAQSSGTPTPTPSTPTTSGALNKNVNWSGVVNTPELSVRTWAGTGNAQLKSYPTIKQGTKVGVCEVVKDKDGDPWYYVKITGDQGEKYGFVSAEYITKQESSTPASMTDDGVLTKTPQWVGKVTASSLNVRTWAGTNNAKIKSWPQLGQGNLVDVCDMVHAQDGSQWYYIRIDGRIYGFVKATYIEKQ